MTPDQILYTHIKTNISYTGTFRYGNAKGSTAPYIIMLKVSDPEEADTLCKEPGEQGEALIQYSGYTEGGTLALLEYLNDFKDLVKGIKGEIGTGSDKIEIWYNTTNAARLLNSGQATETIWGAMFEMTIRWRYV